MRIICLYPSIYMNNWYIKKLRYPSNHLKEYYTLLGGLITISQDISPVAQKGHILYKLYKLQRISRSNNTISQYLWKLHRLHKLCKLQRISGSSNPIDLYLWRLHRLHKLYKLQKISGSNIFGITTPKPDSSTPVKNLIIYRLCNTPKIYQVKQWQ